MEGSDFEAVVFTDACRRSEDFDEPRGQDLYALPELQNGDAGRNDGEEDGCCFFGLIEPDTPANCCKSDFAEENRTCMMKQRLSYRICGP